MGMLRPRRFLGWDIFWGAPLLVLVLSGDSSQADLAFTQPLFDAGQVRTGAPLVHQFHFVNQGPETVAITQVRADCGCLTPRLGRRVYKPGEEGTIEVEINTLSQAAGPHTWRVQIGYQGGDASREVALHLT